MVNHPDGGHLDCDAALAFQVHSVENLLLHVPRRDCARHLQHPVSQGGFPVVNVRNDTEVAYIRWHSGQCLPRSSSEGGWYRSELLC